MRQLARLRRPGRPRRVQEQALGVRRDTVEALRKLGLRPPLPPVAQRSKRDRAPVRVRRVDHDHELELRQVRLNGADLRQLLCVLDEHRPRPGVMQHVVALLRRVRLIDRHDNRARGKGRKTRVRPLRPRVRQDRNPVSRLDAQIDEPKRQLPHHPLELLVGDVNPHVTNLVPERRLAAVSYRRQPDQVSHCPRVRANHPMHPVAPFTFSQAGDSSSAWHGKQKRSWGRVVSVPRAKERCPPWFALVSRRVVRTYTTQFIGTREASGVPPLASGESARRYLLPVAAFTGLVSDWAVVDESMGSMLASSAGCPNRVSNTWLNLLTACRVNRPTKPANAARP